MLRTAAPAAIAWLGISVCAGALQMSASSCSTAPAQGAARQYWEPQMTNPGWRFSLYYTAALVLPRA